MKHNQGTEEYQKSPSLTSSSSNTHSKSNTSKHSIKLGGRKHNRKNRISPQSKGSRSDNIPRICINNPGPLHLEPNIWGGGGNTDPLELILTVKAAAMDFSNSH
jgi:hypothetical protein